MAFFNQYTAPKPIKPASKWYHFLPPVLFWNATKYIFNLVLGWPLGLLLLRAQGKKKQSREVDAVEGCIFERGEVNTHDGAALDTLMITPDNLETDNPMYVINFLGKQGRFDAYDPEKKLYIHVNEMANFAKEFQCKYIGFNYRGIGGSSKHGKRTWSKTDLITDGIAQVNHLINQGVPADKIMIKGHSLGGAVASHVVSYFHQQGVKLHLLNDRSFSSLTNVIVGYIRTLGTKTGHNEPFVLKLLGWMVKPLVKLILVITDWELNAEKAYKSIPNEYKSYFLVRSNKSDRPQDDLAIPHYGSLHRSLKNERRELKNRINKEENSEEKLKLQTELDLLKARKMTDETRSSDSHDVALSHLLNRDSVSAHTFFKQFFDKVQLAAEENSELGNYTI